MNRVIRFNGKRIDNNQWIYGYLFMTSFKSSTDFGLKYCIQEVLGTEYISYEIDPKTIGQFTGLLDINGKEIYEGDIIEYTQHHFNTDMLKTKRKEVKWNNDRWNVYETNAGESDIKVIGNIYENPELLKD